MKICRYLRLLFIYYLLYKSWAKSQNRSTNHMCTD